MMGADHVARIDSEDRRRPGHRRQRLRHREGRADRRDHPRVPRHRRSARCDRRSGTSTPSCSPRPGPTHEKQLLACLEHGKPVMCEKPLTTDVATSLEVVKREAELGKRLIQVGFMRRFDHEYAQLKALLDSGELGRATGAALRAPQPRRPAELRQRDDRQGLTGPRGRRDPLPVRRGDHVDPDHQARRESRCARRSSGSADRDLADRVRQARRRRAVRDHRRRLRGAHRGRRREGQRDDRPRRRTGPQERAGHTGAGRSPPASRSASARPTTSRSSAGWTPSGRERNRRLHRRPGRVGRLRRGRRVRRRRRVAGDAGCPSTWTWSTATRSRAPDA